MKIIYINGSRIPTERAHGLQIMKMCGAFANSNLKTQISKLFVGLWIPRRFNYIKQDPFEYYGISSTFKIKKIPCIDLVPFDKILGPLASWVTELSFIFFVFAHLLSAPPRRRRGGADSSLAGEEYIIYTRDKFAAFFLTFLKKNVFFEAHDVPAKLFFLRFPKIAGIIAITKNLKNEFVKRGVSPEKILVAPDGVDLDEFNIKETQEECRKKLGLPQDKKIIMYTGHLYPWKGAATLLQAASKFQIPSSKFQVLFIFVGGTKKDVQRLSIVNCQMSIVKIIGHRPHSEIPYWLKAADVLVLPNSAKYGISRYWTSPMKLFEYMASGRPIIASNLPSLREILNTSNAVLVSADDTQSLVQAIQFLLRDPSEAERISAQAQRDVLAYSWEKRSEHILLFINKCAR